MNWYLKVLKQYVDFNGRARRKEYWMFTLVSGLITYAILGLATVTESTVISSLYYLYNLVMILPSIAVTIRRLHDTGRSGWWQLLYLLPIVGWIWLIVLLATEGEQRSNQYGQNPKNPYDEIDEIGNN